MKRIAASIVVMASIASTGYVLAQDADQTNSTETSVESSRDGNRFKRGPVDLEQFSKLADIKAADADGDGTLSRQEIEDHALKQMVKRAADRMERRLDVNGDGTVTLDEIEAQKAKEFAALDRNEDGKLDRSEMRSGKSFGKQGQHRGHGFQHKMHHYQR